MRPLIAFIFVLASLGNSEIMLSQTESTAESILSFEEYFGYVKKHHPLVKQANLLISEGEANLLRARGGFDPKIEVDYDRKKFKDIEYYDELNAAFKIPTWYGIAFKADFEENSGEFLDSSLTVPDGGLYSAGVSFSLAQGLLINDRMADLKQARFFIDQTQAERDLLVNQILYEASLAYFKWLEAYSEAQLYDSFLDNARIRLNGIKRSIEEGDRAAIDSTEARIALQNRRLSLEAAQLKRRKAMLEVSNYLWLDGVPLEIQDQMVPTVPDLTVLQSSLFSVLSLDMDEVLNAHPKLRSLDAKLNSLEVERFLKRNKLLPKVDLRYNFLSTEYDDINSFNTNNYKAGLNLSFPLFLRAERGELRLTNLKLQDINFELDATTYALQNKIEATQTEITSLQQQNLLVVDIVSDYERLLNAEERKFELGESSLFLINTREQKLIEANIKAIQIQRKFLDANAELYNVLGVSTSS